MNGDPHLPDGEPTPKPPEPEPVDDDTADQDDDGEPDAAGDFVPDLNEDDA